MQREFERFLACSHPDNCRRSGHLRWLIPTSRTTRTGQDDMRLATEADPKPSQGTCRRFLRLALPGAGPKTELGRLAPSGSRSRAGGRGSARPWES